MGNLYLIACLGFCKELDYVGTIDCLAVSDPKCVSTALHHTLEEDCFHPVSWVSP